jgi:riboflavin kinase/FMN adenylyltransferase
MNIENIDLFKKSNVTSIAIGGFDGMHLAHQELFKSLDKHGAIVVIETGYANLTPKNTRQNYCEYPIYYYPLDEIRHFNAREFLKILKEEYLNLTTIVVGFDFKFGRAAKYTTKDLIKLFNGKVKIVQEYKYQGVAIHSRTIRECLSSGDIKKANTYLNRNYSITGLHIKGQGIGAKQFVATINLNCRQFLIPQAGVYATYTIVDNVKYLSATFIGHRVSTDGQFAIETHIIDKAIKVLNSHVQIEFLDKLRDNKKYDDAKALQKQILTDIINIKNHSK